MASRREAERDLFRTGVYPRGAIPVWGADASGKVSGRPLSHMDQAEFVTLMDRLRSHGGTAV